MPYSRTLGQTVRITAGGLATAGALVSALPGGYLAALTWFGLRAAPQTVDHRLKGWVEASTCRRFAVLIPAHDEEHVISHAIEALRLQRYPADRFEVHVVADNCTDRTADVALATGASVHERSAPDTPGKGAALNWLTERVLTGETESSRLLEGVVIIDADTRVDPEFLAAMNDAFDRGVTAAQGYYAASDPAASPSIALRYAALASRHYLRPLGRSRLGGSIGLFGNGMAFSTELVRDRRWSGHLVEDAEFQLELLLDGITVTFVPDAVLRAEMPDTLDGAVTQNQRWELGRAQLITRFVPDLLRAAVGRSRHHGVRRRTYLDAATDQLVPPISLLATLDVAAVGTALVTTAIWPTKTNRVALGTSVLSLLALVTHIFVALRLVRAPRSVYRSLMSAPKFVLWKLELLRGIKTNPTEVTWTRTQRNQGGTQP